MYSLVTTIRFERRLAKFARAHPDLRKPLAATLRDLESDSFQPHLRLHQLRGEPAGLYATSPTHAYRLILTLKIDEKEITLLDVGSHTVMPDPGAPCRSASA